MGVDRVWIIDPATRTLTMYRVGHPAKRLGGDDEVRDEEILPGFSCRVSDFFEE